jgi:hypothetical protein
VIRIAERANDSFSSLVAFGLLASWFTHVLENVGMTVSVMPMTDSACRSSATADRSCWRAGWRSACSRACRAKAGGTMGRCG